MLRATKPEPVNKRLKLFMFGPAGVGKTTAAIQFPDAYVIDGEKGTENYDKLIAGNKSVVFQTSDVHDVIAEVKALVTERHEFRTLVIDPITPLYSDLLEKCEARVGGEFGRHYGAANKEMKRLANLIMQLDMNVVITAHAKTEYGENLRKLGYTFDGWKQLDYWFDVVIELGKKGKKRMAKVVKTRIETFPDEDVFEWSYEAIRQRWDVGILERAAGAVELASREQVADMKALLSAVRLPDGTVSRWFEKAGVDLWEDMPAAAVDKCIQYVKSRFPQQAPTGYGEKFNAEPDEAKEPTSADANAAKLQSLMTTGALKKGSDVKPPAEESPSKGQLLKAVADAVSEQKPEPEAKKPVPDGAATESEVADFNEFVELWRIACLSVYDWGSAKADAELKKRLQVVSKVGKGATTTPDWRVRALNDARQGKLAAASGKNAKVEEPATAA